MRIAGPGARPTAADDVATALEGAVALLGQRPAITALGADGRREQGFASLAGWVAKGANLLSGELGLGPGGRVGLAGPPGWPLAAVALSAWWVGATIVPATTTSGLDVRVLHTGVDLAGIGDGVDVPTLWFGDGLDGTGPMPAGGGEQWADAVIVHGDRPPRAARDGDLVAVAGPGDAARRQRELLAAATVEEGVLGVARQGSDDILGGADAAARLAALALRPLVTGAATVVIDARDPAREQHARAERITRWYA